MTHHPPRRHPVPPPPNYVADELRRILDEFDGDPNSCHLEPAVRERLLGLTEHVEQVAAAPVESELLEAIPADMSPEQKIRDYAIEDVIHRHAGNGTHLLLSSLWPEADQIAAYIRDGTHPAVEPEPACTCRPVPGLSQVLQGDRDCPVHGDGTRP